MVRERGLELRIVPVAAALSGPRFDSSQKPSVVTTTSFDSSSANVVRPLSNLPQL